MSYRFSVRAALEHTISNSGQRNKKYNGHKGDIPNSK